MRTLGIKIGFVSAVIALVTGIALFLYGSSVGDAYVVAPVVLIVGALIAVVGLLKSLSALAILPGAVYMVALGMYITSQIGNISGRLSDTGFGATGTSLEMLVVFCALMLFAAILALVSSFMDQKGETV